MAVGQLELIVNQVKVLPPADVVLLLKRVAEMLEQKQKSGEAQLGENGIDLQALGINQTQAAELRASFATFEDWDDPVMDIYNDYETAKSALDAGA